MDETTTGHGADPRGAPVAADVPPLDFVRYRRQRQRRQRWQRLARGIGATFNILTDGYVVGAADVQRGDGRPAGRS